MRVVVDTESLTRLSQSAHEAAEQCAQADGELLSAWARTAQVRPELVRIAADGVQVGAALLRLAAEYEARRVVLLVDVALALAADTGEPFALALYTTWGDLRTDALRRLEDAGGALDAGLGQLPDDPLDVLREPGSLGDALEVAVGSYLAAQAARGAPPPARDPAEVAAWWAALRPAERSALLERSPERLGHLDGLPASVRHRANELRLGTEQTALEAERARLLAAHGPDGGSLADRLALRQVEGKLEALEEIQVVLALGDRQLLVLDTSGERVKAAVANGDVDKADHVAVFTPGLSSTVQGSLLDYDDDMAALRFLAGQLSGFACPADTATPQVGSVATVTWLGYDAPQWDELASPVSSVGGDTAARHGAVRLERFLDGIDASRDQPPHLTLLGHSYGSLTSGLALQRGTGVDDVVFFGSPGVGTSRVEDLGVPAGHVFVTEARNDPVADLARFGPDPNRMEGVQGLSAREGRGDASSGHSAYLDKDTTSQYGIAAVVAGQPQLAPRDAGVGVGDALRGPVPGPSR